MFGMMMTGIYEPTSKKYIRMAYEQPALKLKHQTTLLKISEKPDTHSVGGCALTAPGVTFARNSQALKQFSGA